MAEATKISHPKVTKNTGKVERVVDSTIASTVTLPAGTTIVTHMLRSEFEGQKIQDERIKEADDEEASTDTTALTDEFLSELHELYEFTDSQIVESFLEESPTLAGLLFEAYKRIREHFGPEVRMALEVVADPEALGDQQLFVLIRTELPRKEARVHLAELDRGWWLGALPAAEGKMEIALD